MLLRNARRSLPLAAGQRVALVGPVADDPMAMLGCYSFPAHVGVHHPGSGSAWSCRRCARRLAPAASRI